MEKKAPRQDSPAVRAMKAELLESKTLVDFSFAFRILNILASSTVEGKSKNISRALISSTSGNINPNPSPRTIFDPKVLSLFAPSQKKPLCLLVSDPPEVWNSAPPHPPPPSPLSRKQEQIGRNDSAMFRGASSSGRGGGRGGRGRGQGRGQGQGNFSTSIGHDKPAQDHPESLKPVRRLILWLSDFQCQAMATACGSSLPTEMDLLSLSSSRGFEEIKLSTQVNNLHTKSFKSVHELTTFLKRIWINKEFGSSSNANNPEEGPNSKEASKFINDLVEGFRGLAREKTFKEFKFLCESWRKLVPTAMWSQLIPPNNNNINMNNKFRAGKGLGRQQSLVLRAVSIDLEAYEFRQHIITEVGWSCIDLLSSPSLSPQAISKAFKRTEGHTIVKENEGYKNGRHVPDNRHNFAFGETKTQSTSKVIFELNELLSPTTDISNSTNDTTVLLILHNAGSDLKYLEQLGIRFGNSDGKKEGIEIIKLEDLFDVMIESAATATATGTPSASNSSFSSPTKLNDHGVVIIDTQVISRPWIDRNISKDGCNTKNQYGLEKLCEALEIKTHHLHNAGNDAHATLDAFLKLVTSKFFP